MTAVRDAPDRIDALLARRRAAGERFFSAHADHAALLSLRMAERFAAGGRLLALGRTPAARADARRVAVAFVGPAGAGAAPLPAVALTGEGAPLVDQVALVVEPSDVAIAFDALDLETDAALARARERGCLTIADVAGTAEWPFDPGAEDPFVRQELVATLAHLLWELVHLVAARRGLRVGRERRAAGAAGAAGAVHPFLATCADDLDALRADVRRSLLTTAAESAALQARTLDAGRDALAAAAATLRATFVGGGTALVVGDGAAAADVVADLRNPPVGWPARRALDLADDAALVAAIATDAGVEAVFARQVAAYGRSGDALLALARGGDAASVTAALAEARRRDMRTVALVGGDGGRIAVERLADVVVVTRSERALRIAEAQASAWHVVRELIEAPAA